MAQFYVIDSNAERDLATNLYLASFGCFFGGLGSKGTLSHPC